MIKACLNYFSEYVFIDNLKTKNSRNIHVKNIEKTL